jgi:DNA-binding transcriptional LysR family regulator
MHQLVPALPDFLQRYSEIEVELSFADRTVDLITEHADVAMTEVHQHSDYESSFPFGISFLTGDMPRPCVASARASSRLVDA